MSGVKEERFISLLLRLDLEFLESTPKTLINSLHATARNFDTPSYWTLTKELGRRLGYGENSADVRIAQYESGQRTPKQETLIRIAEILEVDVRNFLSPGIATMDELMETLFWMDEENRGLFHLFLLNDSESETVGITIRDKKTMSYLQEWMGKKQKLGDGRITEEEYLEWKLHWPEDKRKTEYKTV